MPASPTLLHLHRLLKSGVPSVICWQNILPNLQEHSTVCMPAQLAMQQAHGKQCTHSLVSLHGFYSQQSRAAVPRPALHGGRATQPRRISGVAKQQRHRCGRANATHPDIFCLEFNVKAVCVSIGDAVQFCLAFHAVMCLVVQTAPQPPGQMCRGRRWRRRRDRAPSGGGCLHSRRSGRGGGRLHIGQPVRH